MIKAAKWCVVFLSFLLSLYFNYSDRDIVAHTSPFDSENSFPHSSFFSSPSDYFCVLHKNDNIGSASHSNVKISNNSLNFFASHNRFSFLKPEFSAIWVSFARARLVNNYFRLILFPFHFFF